MRYDALTGRRNGIRDPIFAQDCLVRFARRRFCTWRACTPTFIVVDVSVVIVRGELLVVQLVVVLLVIVAPNHSLTTRLLFKCCWRGWWWYTQVT
jgi:hypothetical protein